MVRSSTRRQVVLQRRCQPTSTLVTGLGGGRKGYTRCRALAPLYFQGYLCCDECVGMYEGVLKRAKGARSFMHPASPCLENGRHCGIDVTTAWCTQRRDIFVPQASRGFLGPVPSRRRPVFFSVVTLHSFLWRDFFLCNGSRGIT